jgi:hypothetical protein
MITRSKIKSVKLINAINAMREKEKLFSATSLVNYIRNDGIIDYFDIVYKNNYMIDKDNEFKLKKRKYSEIEEDSKLSLINSRVKRKTSFDYIVENGYIFEKIIYDQIKDKMIENNEIKKLAIIEVQDFNDRYNKTLDILTNKKHDIIMGGLLINKLNNTFGYPDLIVSGKWINKYIEGSPVYIKNNSNEYYIIDVKSSSINLINSGENVSSGLLFDGYKAQIYVYTQALNSMLGTKINIGFLLGKKYSYILNKNRTVISNPFGKLGVIDYEYEKLNGMDFSEQITNAIKWKTQLNNEWQSMNLSPIDNDNLYPNMKNHYDKNYKKIKKDVACENKEITLIWNCGIKNRKIAWENGIKKFTDDKLTPNLMGINNKNSRYDIIDKMLFINKQNSINVILSVKNNYMNWQKECDHEFFVDFETYSHDRIFDENSDNFIESLNLQIIYMIGVSYKNKHTNNLEFKCFIIDFENSTMINKYIDKHHKCTKESYIFCLDEKDLIIKFVEFINRFKQTRMSIGDYYKQTRLIHWSQAEPIIFNKKIREYRLEDEKFKLNWYDLLKVFKYEKEPIIIKNCYSFGLKEIIKNLNSHGFINLVWPELDDGLLSSFIARDIYLNPVNNNVNNNVNNKVFNLINIVEYNYIDCLAIDKLLKWMRSYL